MWFQKWYRIWIGGGYWVGIIRIKRGSFLGFFRWYNGWDCWGEGIDKGGSWGSRIQYWGSSWEDKGILKKLDLEVLDFGLYSETDVLEWFLNRLVKHARTLVLAYLQINIFHIYCIIVFWRMINVLQVHEVNYGKSYHKFEHILKVRNLW